MKPLLQLISHLLLAAWFVVLAGPAVGPLSEAVSSLFEDDSAQACCCGEMCACSNHDDSTNSCTPLPNDTHNSTCVSTTSLFSSIGLVVSGYFLPRNLRVEHRLLTSIVEPDQVVLNTLYHPPRISFAV